jgi:hypothetical protein
MFRIAVPAGVQENLPAKLMKRELAEVQGNLPEKEMPEDDRDLLPGAGNTVCLIRIL